MLPAILCSVVIASYIFFATGGTGTKFTRHQYAYYAKLGDAFLRGETFLRIQPDSTRLPPDALNDPERSKEIPWDVSFYKGRYYLYWGYVPGVVVAVGKQIGVGTMGDTHATFVFHLVRVIATGLVMLQIVTWWPGRYSSVLLGAGFLASAWAAPFPYALGRAAVYEAAIAGGQSFWALAMLFGVRAFTSRSLRARRALLWCVGTCLALAICCRLVLFPSVLLLLIASAILHHRAAAGGVTWRHVVVPFAVPMALALLSLALYNYVRFESPLEFGYSHIRTYPFPAHPLSPIYLAPNLWNYLLRPPELLPAFPFVLAPWDPPSPLPTMLSNVRGYIQREPLVGLVPGVPVVLFAMLIPLRSWFLGRGSANRGIVDQRALAATEWVLAASLWFGISSMVVTSLYFVATMRYLADFLPAMLLAGFTAVVLASRTPSVWSQMLAYAYAGMAAITCVVGWLLWQDSYVGLLEWRNPQLYEWLTSRFGGQ